jgi:acyl-CoA dehydrogenase
VRRVHSQYSQYSQSGPEKGAQMDSDVFDSVLSTVRRFVRDEVVPREAEIEESDDIPADLVKGAAELGLFGYALPEEYGGLGLTIVEDVELAFELGYASPAFRSLFGTNNGIAGQVIVAEGSDEQRQRYLPAMAGGDLLASFALSEPEAGSDAASLVTTAERDGDTYRLNGTKRFITNAPRAGLFVVFARTGEAGSGARGISTFLVEAGTPGITVEEHDQKMGQSGSWTADVIFRDATVPASARVGEEGKAFRTAMRSLDRGRLHIAAVCVGMAERLLEESVTYAAQRRQFGEAIGSFQLIQGMLADSKTEAYAGRCMVRDAARRFASGESATTVAACAKYFCSEMVGRVADRAVQVHGGNGYMRGVPVERFYRDARLFRIYEGTSQIQQIVIARSLLREAR